LSAKLTIVAVVEKPLIEACAVFVVAGYAAAETV